MKKDEEINEQNGTSRPILVFYLSMFGLTSSQFNNNASQLIEQIGKQISTSEYICLLLPTTQQEHRVELLSPALLTEDQRDIIQKKYTEMLESFELLKQTEIID